MDFSSQQACLAARVFDTLRAIDLDATSVRDGYPTGLRWLHGALGRSGKDTTEDAISEALAQRLPGAAGIVSAVTQVPYPVRLRDLGDGITRGTCDLVLELDDGSRVWIEVKGAWPYLRDGSSLKRNRSYVKHLVSPTEGAARDFAKLVPMTPDEADVVGVLVLGFDIDAPDTPWAITDDHLAELETNGRVEPDGWRRHEAAWTDPHAHRVYGDDLSALCRTRCFFWLRGNERSPLERLAALLERRNAVDASIADLIGRPAEKGHIGEFVAAQVFDIDLHASANHPGSDGVFRSGPLAGKTVNVKIYGVQDGLLDIATGAAPDLYLVLTGPERAAAASRGSSRPFTIDHVYVFDHQALIDAGVRPGTASSVRKQLWRDAEVFPSPSASALLGLTEDQVRALRSFSSGT